MEASFYGNLNQRKLVNSSGCPETTFFAAFAEMARRIWILHCLAFSVDQEVSTFNVGKNCRFSEVYMESVTSEALLAGNDGNAVAFTVVPGFKIGKTVVQSKVYQSQAKGWVYILSLLSVVTFKFEKVRGWWIYNQVYYECVTM